MQFGSGLTSTEFILVLVALNLNGTPPRLNAIRQQIAAKASPTKNIRI